ncbi:MAG: hypothetical protein K1X83_05790 [Oligoflexia bacterium]|nr:hypothetical protein [Oligoflexia bacterium]
MKALIFMEPLHLGQSKGAISNMRFTQAAQLRLGLVSGSGNAEIGTASRFAPRALAEKVPK